MDEESLFRDIHRHLVSRAGSDEPDTEEGLAERFNVSRYRIRRVLDKLEQYGCVERTKKRGISVTTPPPALFSSNLREQLATSSFELTELLEARERTALDVLPLALRRLTPMVTGRLSEIISNMENCIDFHAASVKLHMEFHRTLIASCANRVLTGYAQSLTLLFEDRLGERAHFEHVTVSQMLSADRSLLKALRNEDEEAARAALLLSLREETDLLTNRI